MMSDALLPFLDYRGWVFGINDATEREVGGDSFEMAYYAFRDPRYSGGAGRPAAPQGLHPGVKTDSRKNVLGIILAAAAAILCTIIDQVMKEE